MGRNRFKNSKIVNNRGVLGVAWVSDAMKGVGGAVGVSDTFRSQTPRMKCRGLHGVSDAMNGVFGAVGCVTPVGVRHLGGVVQGCGVPALRCLTPKVSDTASEWCGWCGGVSDTFRGQTPGEVGAGLRYAGAAVSDSEGV